MKKIVSIVLICVMLSTMFIPTFAANDVDTSRIIVDGVDITIDIEDEIQRAKSGITDIETTPDFFRAELIADEEDMGVSGGWAAEKDPTTGQTPTVYDMTVNVEWYYDASHRDSKDFTPDSDSFSYPQSEFENWTAWRFALETTAKITGKPSITLNVGTSIFT